MNLEQLLDRMRDQKNPKAAVELPFEWAALEWADSSPESHWDPPASQPLADQFLEDFSRLVRRERRKDKSVPGGEIDEPKLLREARADALQELRGFNQEVQTLAFPHLHRQRFAFELALFVRRPRLLSPTEAAWSGPACLLIHYAKADPLGFARLAMDLARRGAGLWRGQTVQVPLDAREAVSADVPNTCAAALVAAVAGQPPQFLAGPAPPAALAEWMRRLGYREVEVHSAASLAVAREAAAVVLLCLAPVFLSSLAGRSAGEPHWALLRRIRTMPDGIYLKVIALGAGWEGVLDETSLASGVISVIAAI